MTELLVLRLVHVVSGILWVGAIVFMSGFLMPAMQQAGPAGGPVMSALVQRRAMTYMPTVATLTILSGLRLYWIMSGGFAAEYLRSSTGAAFGIAGLAALLGYALGMVVARPAMARVGVLAGRVPTVPEAERAALQAEIGRLRARGRVAGTAVAVLVVLSAAGMAVARYL